MSEEKATAQGSAPAGEPEANIAERLDQLAAHIASTITCAWCTSSWARYGPWGLLAHLTGWHQVPVEGAAKILAREFEGSSEEAWVPPGQNGHGDWESWRTRKAHY